MKKSLFITRNFLKKTPSYSLVSIKARQSYINYLDYKNKSTKKAKYLLENQAFD